MGVDEDVRIEDIGRSGRDNSQIKWLRDNWFLVLIMTGSGGIIGGGGAVDILTEKITTDNEEVVAAVQEITKQSALREQQNLEAHQEFMSELRALHRGVEDNAHDLDRLKNDVKELEDDFSDWDNTPARRGN